MSRIVPCAAIGLLLGVSVPLDVGAASPASGIRGKVTSSPTCPVERTPPDPGCAPRGFPARVTVRRAADNHVAARITTKDDGRYSVALKAGRYSVSARPASGSQLPTCPQGVKATVRPGRWTRLTIDCDSGIR
jgi:hypothetical protein